MIAAFAVACAFGLYLVRDRRLADRRDRHRVDHRRHRLHRRAVAARLSRPRRRVRDGVLRLRRGVRHRVRAARHVPCARDVGVDARRRARDRDPRRQQPARSRDRRARRQAHARGSVRPARRDRRVRARCSRSRTPSRSGSRSAAHAPWRALPLVTRAARARAAAPAGRRAATAPRSTRCSPRPAQLLLAARRAVRGRPGARDERSSRVDHRIVRWPIEARGAARGGAASARPCIVARARRHAARSGSARRRRCPACRSTRSPTPLARRRALAARVPFALDRRVTRARSPTGITTAPAARFAIETALLIALAQQRAARASPQPAREPTPQAELAQRGRRRRRGRGARSARSPASRCLKIKVAGAERRSRPRAPRSPRGARRAGCASTRTARGRATRRATLLAALARAADRVRRGAVLDAHELLGEPLPCPIALDESLDRARARRRSTRALESPSLAALVLKPTCSVASRAASSSPRRRTQHGVAPIVTHALEGPIGTAACHELARAIGADIAGRARRRTPRLRRSLSIAAIRCRRQPRRRSARDPHARPRRAVQRTPWHVEAPRALVATARASRRILRDPRRARRNACRSRCSIRSARADRARAPARARRRARRSPTTMRSSCSRRGSTGAAARRRATRAASILAAARASAAHLGWRDDDRWLARACRSPTPAASSIVVRCLAARLPIVLHEGDFDAAAIRAADRDSACTLASLVPTQLAALLDDPAWRPPRAPARRAARRRGRAARSDRAALARGVPFLPTYGLTETFGQVATALRRRAVRRCRSTASSRRRHARRAAPIRIRGPMLATPLPRRRADRARARHGRPRLRRARRAARPRPRRRRDHHRRRERAPGRRSRRCSRRRPACAPRARSASPMRGGARSSQPRSRVDARSTAPPPPRAGTAQLPPHARPRRLVVIARAAAAAERQDRSPRDRRR